MIILIKLFLAHLLGDFILQPDSWVKDKEFKKLKSKYLYIHVLIHGILILLLIWDILFWPYAIILMISHWLIDVIKLQFQKDHNKRIWFTIDQCLHVFTLIIVWYYLETPTIDLSVFDTQKVLVLVTCIIFLTNPSSVIIKTLVSKWTPNTQMTQESLPDAGKYIGILERLFVFAFVITNHWEAVGFLLAAKSVFRFGDLKDARDMKLTEYILIGTLMSFGIAISIGLILSISLRHL